MYHCARKFYTLKKILNYRKHATNQNKPQTDHTFKNTVPLKTKINLKNGKMLMKIIMESSCEKKKLTKGFKKKKSKKKTKNCFVITYSCIQLNMIMYV